MDTRKIFISYRRSDARADAGRLYDRLEARYPGRVFRDVGSLEPGVEWQEAIDTVLASTHVLIVVIGPGWLNAADANGKRRIDDVRDEVRKEVASALKSGIRVFPVMVGGARMPTEEDLPDDVRPLVRRHALELTEQDFNEDLNKLEKAIERTPGWAPSRTSWSSAARLVPALAVFALFAVLAATYTLQRVGAPSPGPSPQPPSKPPVDPLVPVTPPILVRERGEAPSPGPPANPPPKPSGVPAQPAEPSPVAQAARAAAKTAIQQSLEEYRAAYGRLDLDGIRRVFPTANENALRQQLRQVRSIDYTFTGAPTFPDLNLPAGKASVEIGVELNLEMRSGSSQPPVKGLAKITLHRLGPDSDRWVIDHVHYP